VLAESDFGHGHTHYEVELGTRPHMHLVALDSDEVKEVTSVKLENAISDLLKKEGFSVKRYNIQIFGNFAGKPKDRRSEGKMI
jgi:Fe2+ or Zn2+ uptake regulation protein